MVNKVRTIDFLPEIFRTDSNRQFLNATLDVLTQQPNFRRVEGYVGEKYGYGIDPYDQYVSEINNERKNYQLKPSVVFLKDQTPTVKDFIDYPGILKYISNEDGNITNNNRLFNNEFYTWDPFIDLDKLLNYKQYYWIPLGPIGVPVTTVSSGAIIYQEATFNVTKTIAGVEFQELGGRNPTITLLRGGTYKFKVTDNERFWIQGIPGLTGFDTSNNINTRELLGVTNNGNINTKIASISRLSSIVTVNCVSNHNLKTGNTVKILNVLGSVNTFNGQYTVIVIDEKTFTYSQGGLDEDGIVNENSIIVTGIIQFIVPDEDSQDQYDLPGSQTVDLVTTLPYASINGVAINSIDDISGNLNGRTLIFYNNGDPSVQNKIYTISQPMPGGIITLSVASTITQFNKITITNGTQYINRTFFLNGSNVIELIPYLSSKLTQLYYQSETDPNSVGIIRIIDTNTQVYVDIEKDILGKQTYTSPNGVPFTNGLKVRFDFTALQEEYRYKDFYVEGVGSSIQLMPVTRFAVTEVNREIIYRPWDSEPWDTEVWDIDQFVIYTPQYVTMKRNSRDYNAWTRSNRWFHKDVLDITQQFVGRITNSEFLNPISRAERPILEYRENLQLYDSGTTSLGPIDLFDTTTTDPLVSIIGLPVGNPAGTYPEVDGVTLNLGSKIIFSAATDEDVRKSVYSIDYVAPQSLDGYYNNTISTPNFISTGIKTFFTAPGLSYNPAGGDLVVVYVDNVRQLFGNTVSYNVTTGQIVVNVTSAEGEEIAAVFVTGASGNGTTATITFNEEPVIPYVVGSQITVANMVPAGYNGTYTVTACTKTSVSYSNATTGPLTVVGFVIGPRALFSWNINLQGNEQLYINLVKDQTYEIIDNSQVHIKFGVDQLGTTWRYSEDSGEWDECQKKTQTNQYPKFDVYDRSGISFGNSTFYPTTTFEGSVLFSYTPGSGQNDPILGFPITYSNIANLGDISFTVNLNSDTFTYTDNAAIITKHINSGYVHQNITPTTYDILTGWLPAADISYQRQIYEITSNFDTDSFEIDVAIKTSTAWAPIVIYVDDDYLDQSQFTYTVNSNSTTILLNTTLKSGTKLTFLVISDQISSTAYYATPTNLEHNPFNENVVALDIGDIRTQFESIFTNVPGSAGHVSGPNNSRDLGNILQYGTTIIKNSASMILPGLFARKSELNLLDSLQFTSEQYYSYKALLADITSNTDFLVDQTPESMLDYVVTEIKNSKKLFNAFLWTDMLPSGSPYVVNKYNITIVSSVFSVSLSKTYDYTKANYDGICVYLTRKTPVIGYSISSITRSGNLVTVTTSTSHKFLAGNEITISNVPTFNGTYTISNIVSSTVLTFIQIGVNQIGFVNYDSEISIVNSGITQTTQLIKNRDYTVSDSSPTLTITYDLIIGDVITVKEYNQTYGSYCPSTPSSLGLYPAYIPDVILDTTYLTPTYFIRGHDGSYHKLYGKYLNGRFTDFRDTVLLEFEKRVYNNIKISKRIPLTYSDVFPGQFRATEYSYDEIMEIYSVFILNWIGGNRLDHKQQVYTATNKFSYNYSDSSSKVSGQALLQGHWRGIYRYLYDTDNPAGAPWEMLGISEKPSWWDSRYGSAPYTSDNIYMWNEISNGYIWNSGNPYIDKTRIRNGLLNVLPIDSAGNLLNPLDAIVANYNALAFIKSWKIGDGAPVEASYLKSSNWPYDLMKILSLTKPAKFFNLFVDLDRYFYDEELKQYLYDNRDSLDPSDIELYGNGIAKHSYLNFVVDYVNYRGENGFNYLHTLIKNTDVRLSYRLAGFSSKNNLRFYIDHATPSGSNSALVVPDESYTLMMYDNVPEEKINYSSVTIQRVSDGWTVWGNSANKTYFNIVVPKMNGNYNKLQFGDVTVTVAKEYYEGKINRVVYGTKFYTQQAVSEFLINYGNYLQKQGLVFQTIENNVLYDWNKMVREFILWSEQDWIVGTTISINPSAKHFIVNKDGLVVNPLTIQNKNFILNQNLAVIESRGLAVIRDNTRFEIKVLNDGDTVAFTNLNLSSFEHAIIFDNYTSFNDVVYKKTSGLRQRRLLLQGYKTAEWNGFIDAQGFILSEDNINDWQPNVKYSKGIIVNHKNSYWTANSLLEPVAVFNPNDWTRVSYEEIKTGLLPNASTNSVESLGYYETNTANLESDADLLSFSLIGYRPRAYMSSADLSDISQVNIYKEFLPLKGSNLMINNFKNVEFDQGKIDYQIHENWAIKTGDLGTVLNSNFIEVVLNEQLLKGNPTLLGFSDTQNENVQQTIALNEIINWDIAPQSYDFMPLYSANILTRGLPSAGYVNLNDVKYNVYQFEDLNQDETIIDQLRANDIIWIANYKSSWNIFSAGTLGVNPIRVDNNQNGTATITFSAAHNLKVDDIIAISNFETTLNGFYEIKRILSLTSVLIVATIENITTFIASGLGFKLISRRFHQASDAVTNLIPNTEFIARKIWVDKDVDNSWAVWGTAPVFNENSLTFTSTTDSGFSVDYSNTWGYLYSDPTLNSITRVYNGVTRTITNAATGFGKKIEIRGKNIFVASNTRVIRYQKSIFKIDSISRTSNLVTVVVTPLEMGDTFTSGNIITITGVESTLSFNGNFTITAVNATTFTYAQTGSNETGNVNQTSYAERIYNEITIINNANYTNFAVSGDSNWIYISRVNDQAVDVFMYNSISGNYDLATTLSRPTNTLSSIQRLNNLVTVTTTISHFYTTGMYVTISGVSGFNGTYVITVLNATQFTYTQIAANATGSVSISSLSTIVATGWGNELTTNLDGSKLIIAASSEQLHDLQNSGAAYIYARKYQSFIASGSTTVFTVQGTIHSSKAIVYVNGVQISAGFSVSTSAVTFSSTPSAGSVIYVEFSDIVLLQRVASDNPYLNGFYGHSLDTNRYGAEILIGAPFEIETIKSASVEGIVYRYTNSGQRYGIITSINPSVSTGDKILINGYLVNFTTSTNVVNIATQINNQTPTNILATGDASTNTLTISIIDDTSEIPFNIIDLVADQEVQSNLNIQLYVKTQSIYSVDNQQYAQFGYAVKMNEQDSLIISAPTANRRSVTRFDDYYFCFDDQTIFDGDLTSFIENEEYVGIVYHYQYLPAFNEEISNTGKYTFGQYISTNKANKSNQPQFGSSISYRDGIIVVGTPNYYANNSGLVVAYTTVVTNPEKCQVVNTTPWYIDKKSINVVDINKIREISIYNKINNETLSYLDYIDPVQGKLLGAVQSNLDFITETDPAIYDNISAKWGPSQVGLTWLDTTNLRMLNYYQPDVIYNSENWGKTFPGSIVDIYTWIESVNQPLNYIDEGIPINFENFVSYTSVNIASNALITKYYFWVKSYNIVPKGKSLAPTILAQYIFDPVGSGIPYFAPISSTVFALYNSEEFIRDVTSILHVGYGIINTNDSKHTNYELVGDVNIDEFLNGFPTFINSEPKGLYLKYIDSFSGVDKLGLSVPNPSLPPLLRTGINFRPRQSMFFNRERAVKNYIQYVNKFLLIYPITELRSFNYLQTSGVGYDTRDFWHYIDWWVDGYDNTVKASLEVNTLADLQRIVSNNSFTDESGFALLELQDGLVARVKTNNIGLSETYVWNQNVGWSRVGLSNGTIEFKDTIIGGAARWIIRWINEILFTDDFLNERNNSLILMFKYIQSESIDQQNYLPWLNKTSMIDVKHTIRQLLPYKIYKRDNQDFLFGYLNEIKPYHVYIKDFVYTYDGIDTYDGVITDFDLPAEFVSARKRFESPQLIFVGDPETGEYTVNDSVWQKSQYTQWWLNRGFSILKDNEDVINATTIMENMDIITTEVKVNNIVGLPVVGYVIIKNELIYYGSVDRTTNTIKNMIRGINESTIEAHFIGEIVKIIPNVVNVINSGRAYNNAPKITTYVDTDFYPIPTQYAELAPIMTLDRLIGVDVVDTGRGYPVSPTILIEGSSITSTFNKSNIVVSRNEISLVGNQFETGDGIRVEILTDSIDIVSIIRNLGIVTVITSIAHNFNNNDNVRIVNVNSESDKFTGAFIITVLDSVTFTYVQSGENEFGILDSASVAILNAKEVYGLVHNGYYYIRKISQIGYTNNIALYTSYERAIQINTTLEKTIQDDITRVILNNIGNLNIKISVAGKAALSISNSPIRMIMPRLNFSRITYSNFATQWTAGTSYVADVSIVVYNHKLYRCRISNSDSVFQEPIEANIIIESIVYTPGSPGVVTVTARSEHNLVSGILVDLVGTINFNGNFGPITVISPTIFTYSRVGSFSITEAGGIVIVRNVWQELEPSNPYVTSADKVKAYYKPTANMPGNDLRLLSTGTEYPYSIFKATDFDDTSTAFDIELSGSTFTSTTAPLYIIDGGEFTDGYSPEELVSGVVSDSINVTVTSNDAVLQFRLFLTKERDQYVFNTNPYTKTTLAQPFDGRTDTSIVVADYTKVTTTTSITVTTNSAGLVFYAGSPIIYNVNASSIVGISFSISVPSGGYTWTATTSASIELVVPSAPNQTFTINIIEGRMIYINNEYIGFTSVNTSTNTLSGLRRGMLGSPTNGYYVDFTNSYSPLPAGTIVQSVNVGDVLYRDATDLNGDYWWYGITYPTDSNTTLAANNSAVAVFLKRTS